MLKNNQDYSLNQLLILLFKNKIFNVIFNELINAVHF